MNWLALILLSIVPQDDRVLREQVDLAEVNSFYDEEGRLVFIQLIWWDWQRGRYQVRDWRLVKNEAILPRRDWERGGYVSFWQDGQYTRKVHAKALKESWTQWDVELVEREVLAKEKRIPLMEPKKRVKIKSPNGGDECSNTTPSTM